MSALQVEPVRAVESRGSTASYEGAELLAHAHDVARSADDATTWPAPRRRALLAEVDRSIAVLTTVRAALLLAERSAGSWQGSGDPSFETWRGRTSRGGRRAAHAELRQAEVLHDLPEVRAATVAGVLGIEHVDVLARAAHDASPVVRDAMRSAEGQTELLGLARADATQFGRSLGQWMARLEPAGLERDHEAQRGARFVHLADTPGGTRITGLLDRMAGHRLRLALESASPRPPADDDRSSEQRRADALDALAQRVLALPDTTPGAAVRPHVSLIVPAATWAAWRSARRGGQQLPPSGTAPATLEDGTPVPPTALAEAMCDCELTRVVMDADSLPMDLGRTQRLYTGAQRRAVIARDGGCGWPDCDAPPRWCEIHHIRWWDRDGGTTSLENGVLLCSFHHHEVHRRDLTLVRETGPGNVGGGGGDRRVRYRLEGRVRSPGLSGGPPGPHTRVDGSPPTRQVGPNSSDVTTLPQQTGSRPARGDRHPAPQHPAVPARAPDT
ncbi:MAG TPA: DUF222 domain-containing protein [Actinotalea sp.]|nr:DUF222 domain-containing protein [Actinotalea sp.]